jgi:hypothetical protein
MNKCEGRPTKLKRQNFVAYYQQYKFNLTIASVIILVLPL